MKFSKSLSGISQILPAIVSSKTALGNKPRTNQARTVTCLTLNLFAASEAFNFFFGHAEIIQRNYSNTQENLSMVLELGMVGC